MFHILTSLARMNPIPFLAAVVYIVLTKTTAREDYGIAWGAETLVDYTLLMSQHSPIINEWCYRI